MTDKPFAPSAENNKIPIFKALNPYLPEHSQLFEIASGTGQHLVYFADKRPDITFLGSDRQEKLPGINAWITDANLTNIQPAVALDVNQPTVNGELFDTIYSANSAHIMSEAEVEKMFAFVSEHLKTNGVFALYGPFMQEGKYTASSNARFDQHLRAEASHMGIRDICWLIRIAKPLTLTLEKKHLLPKNNMLLIFRKIAE